MFCNANAGKRQSKLNKIINNLCYEKCIKDAFTVLIYIHVSLIWAMKFKIVTRLETGMYKKTLIRSATF